MGYEQGIRTGREDFRASMGTYGSKGSSGTYKVDASPCSRLRSGDNINTPLRTRAWVMAFEKHALDIAVMGSHSSKWGRAIDKIHIAFFVLLFLFAFMIQVWRGIDSEGKTIALNEKYEILCKMSLKELGEVKTKDAS